MNLPKYDRYVYMLFAGDAACPPFYVGIGKHGTRRHEKHEKLHEKSNPAKNQFILECKAAGIPIRYVIPETCLTIDEAYRGERELISIWGRRELGGCLFNMNAGGAGGRDPAPSTRAKMAEASRGQCRRLSPSARAKISAALRGKRPSPATMTAAAAANLGRKLSPEHCAKVAEALRGNKHLLGHKHSPETCAKLSAANRRRHATRIRSPDQSEFKF